MTNLAIKKQLLSHLSIWLSVILLYAFFVPGNIPKYLVSNISTTVIPEGFSYFYEDLDYDGNSELLEFIDSNDSRFGLIIRKNGKVIQQWNFKGGFANTFTPFYSDYDNDRIKEVIVFTVRNDSLFLNTLDFTHELLEISDQYICNVNKDNGKYDFTIYPIGSMDVNHNGYKELFWGINSAFSKYPRNFFSYYPQQNKVYISPQSCNNVAYPIMVDIDGDSIPEFFNRITHACGNCRPEEAFSDQENWLMVFTHDMEFKFKPVSFPAHPAITRTIPLQQHDSYNLLIHHTYLGNDSVPSFTALYSPQGKLIDKKKFAPNKNTYYSPYIYKDSTFSEVFQINHLGEVNKIDHSLQSKKVKEIEIQSNAYVIHKKDIDNDGKEELLIPGKNIGEIIIYQNDFTHPFRLFLKERASANQFSIVLRGDADPHISVCTAKHHYIFQIKRSRLFIYRHWLLIPVLLFAWFILFIIKKIKDYQRLKIENIKCKMSELQIKSAQKQLDPHFTLNLFSSFANLINEKDSEKAEVLFSKYAHLLRITVLNSDKILICLKDEIAFIESYMALEAFRYTNKFRYTIDIDKNINQHTLIPKMLLHTFIENAIKHGLKHLNSNGLLTIKGKQLKQATYFSISDNGIGRKKAKEIQILSTEKGLKIIDMISTFYHRIYNQKIKYTITDLYNKDKASGTLVELWIYN